MKGWEQYADACLRVAEARGEVVASWKAAHTAAGSPLHATMRAIAVDADNRLFVAEVDAVAKRNAVIAVFPYGGK